MLQSSGRREGRKSSNTQWLQDACRVTAFIQRGAAASPNPGFQAWLQLLLQWLAWLEKNFTNLLSGHLQHFLLKTYEWMLLQKKDGSWCPVPFENWQNYMMAEPSFSEAFVVWGSVYVSICEPMGHRTMKILEEQGYTQGLSAVLLKKAKLLILFF